MLEKLQEIDPVRKNYYEWIEEKVRLSFSLNSKIPKINQNEEEEKINEKRINQEKVS